MKKIVYFSIENINNAGDELLRLTTDYLVHQSGVEVATEQIELIPKNSQTPFFYKFDLFLGNVVKWFALRFKNTSKEYKLRNLCYKIQYTRFFKSKIKKSDAIVYPMGMLKYSTQNCCYQFAIINQLAEKYGKPVLMSAMSIEKPNEGDYRYHLLVDAVNRKSVKVITSRDGQDGVDRLRNYYLKRNDVVTDFVGDPALWIPECFGLKKTNKQNGKLVGIGLIRKGIFSDYKEEVFSDEHLISFYKDLASELDSQNLNWKLFCNGIDEDYQVGLQILKELGKDTSYLVKCPRSAEEFVHQITEYDAVFGARLHACISPFSLGIPVVGMLWDNKLKFFAKTMKIDDFFVEAKSLNGKYVSNKIVAALNCNIDITNRDTYKLKTKKSIVDFIQSL